MSDLIKTIEQPFEVTETESAEFLGENKNTASNTFLRRKKHMNQVNNEQEMSVHQNSGHYIETN